MAQRNNIIDLAKFVASLLVVAIHSALFKDVNSTLFFVFNELICRLGVPFFAICTGFYMYKAIIHKGFEILKKQEWKLLRLYALWTFLYFLFLLPSWIVTNYFSFGHILGYGKSAVLTGSYFHLWYVLDVIYAMPIFYLIVKYISPKVWIWFVIILYGLYALNYGYIQILPYYVSLFLSIINRSYAIVSAQFVVLPMLLCGALYAHKKTGSILMEFEINNTRNNVMALLISSVFLFFEALLLRYYVHHTEVSYIIMILPTAYFIFVLLQNISCGYISYAGTLGKMSLIVYCVHPMFCLYVQEVISNTIIVFGIVCVLSIIVAFVCVKLFCKGKEMNRSVIVLTSCVNPNGMSYTVLQDVKERKRQYVDALNFYLKETLLPIVFVENSNTDFSMEFQSYIDSGRLEYITYDGNNGFDKIKGKGYGEALMLLYAIEHSTLIKSCKYMIKITGRLKVENINKIANSRWLNLNNLWRCNVENEEWVATTVFVSSPYILKKFLERHKEEITEENRGHNWIENVLARAMVSDKDIHFCLLPFTYPPLFEAYSGTSQSKYDIKDSFINATDNFHYASILMKSRGDRLGALFMKKLRIDTWR